MVVLLLLALIVTMLNSAVEAIAELMEENALDLLEAVDVVSMFHATPSA